MTEEDLILGTPDGEYTEEMETEFYDYDDVQMLLAACEALGSVEGINAMTAADTKRMTRIKKKCLRMIDFYINELYELTFDDDDNNKDE
jgi:hypothetical protein